MMFSENLKTARKAKDLTQAALAAQLHVVRQTVSKWEKGLSVPDADLLLRLSEILEVPASRLLGAKNDLAPKSADAIAEQLAGLSARLADKPRRRHRFAKVFLAMAGSFIAYLAGAVIEISPSWTLPGFGLLLALLTMGGFLAFYSLE